MRLNIPESFTEQSFALFGEDGQMDILQEECAELIKAISKIKRGKENSRKNLIEELSHVLMSCQLVGKIHGITQADIDQHIKIKSIKYNFSLPSPNEK